MKKMLMLSGLVAVLAACGGTHTGDERTAEETSVATVESNLCGLGGCGTNEYIQKYDCACAPGCYGSSGTKTTTICAAIPSTQGFAACGLNPVASSDHYVSGYGYNSDCSPTWPGDSSTKNQTTYQRYPSPSNYPFGGGFYACGSSCPTGFYAHSYYYSGACSQPANPAPTSGSNNQVHCVVIR